MIDASKIVSASTHPRSLPRRRAQQRPCIEGMHRLQQTKAGSRPWIVRRVLRARHNSGAEVKLRPYLRSRSGKAQTARA